MRSFNLTGMVIKSVGALYDIWIPKSQTIIQAKLRGKLKLQDQKLSNPIAIGDKVLVEYDGNEYIISNYLKRENYIIRKSTHKAHHAHILAANIECAYLIVTITSPQTSLGFIDRFLVSCEAFRIPAVLVFNKCDLWNETTRPLAQKLMHLYRNIGYTCFEVSATEKIGLDDLKMHMNHTHMLLSGHSGVGKTALLNALFNVNRKSGEISASSKKGKHTTTFAEAIQVSENSWITDTPGIKELGLYDINKSEISHFFPEMRKLIGQCKYNSCVHINEPDCAVKYALSASSISASRYKNYVSMYQDEDSYR